MAAEDEATFGLIPVVTRGWGKRGGKPTAIINFAHEFVHVFGTRSKKTFVFSFSKRKRQKDFMAHLLMLERRWKRVLLFVDGAPCHKRNGKVLGPFLDNHRNIRLVYFPKYTPELNPTEQCWKAGRKGAANKLLMNMPAMKYNLRKTFNDKNSLPKMFHYLVN